MPIEIFGSLISPFVDKVTRALRLKALPFELVLPSRFGDFARWSPNTRKMPAARIEGETLSDSTFILRRIEQLKPLPPLFAAEAEGRAAQRLLEDWADESLYWLRMALLWQEPERAANTILATLSIPVVARPLVRRVIMRQLGAQVRAQGMGRLSYETLVRELGLRLDDLVGVLGVRPFFFGDAPGAADIAVAAQLHFPAGAAGQPDIAKALSERPALAAWKERVDGRSLGDA
ncbi:MAG: glutathione S-transferase family protein [Myxococcota bacterium]